MVMKRSVSDTSSEAPPSNIARRRSAARQSDSGRYQNRRGIIQAAAAAVFREKGVQRSTLDDIGQRAGIDRATIYYYYGSKEALLRDMIGPVVAENVSQAQKVAESAADAREKLASLITALMRSYSEHYPYLYIYVEEHLRVAQASTAQTDWDEEVNKWARGYYLAVESIIVQGLETGVIRPVASARLLTRAIIGLLNSTSMWFGHRVSDDADEVARAFVSLVSQGMFTSAGS
jgi:AcrR family transcriptional regulator